MKGRGIFLGLAALLAADPIRAAVFPCSEQGILDAIAAGGGPHTFSCGGATVVTTAAEIEIDNSVILDGEGDLTVDGGDAHRVFSVAAGVTAELRNLTVRNGSTDGSSALASGPGAGIQNLGNLTLSNCTISDSQTGDYLGADGGGIYNGGTLTVTNSTISRNVVPLVYGQGGGIRSAGTLVLESSTVSDNFGAAAGGISAYGTTTVINSTISGNSTASGGAGIESAGTLTVTNSTISGLHPFDPGEAILNSGTADLTNTLIEGECGGQLLSHGGNVESPGDTCSLTDATDQVGVSSSALALGPLADNGGPTETRELWQGSAAIDAAVACPPPNEDQRGVLRPQGVACDIGAYELIPGEYVGDIPMCKSKRGKEMTVLVPPTKLQRSLDKGLTMGECPDAMNGVVMCKSKRGKMKSMVVPHARVQRSLAKGLTMGVCRAF